MECFGGEAANSSGVRSGDGACSSGDEDDDELPALPPRDPPPCVVVLQRIHIVLTHLSLTFARVLLHHSQRGKDRAQGELHALSLCPLHGVLILLARPS